MENKIDWLTIVISDSHGGGSEQIQRNLISHLSKKGETCNVIVVKRTGKKAWDYLNNRCSIKFLPFKSIGMGYLYLWVYLFFYLRRNPEISYIITSHIQINGLVSLYKRVGLIKKRTKVILRESNSIFELFSGLKLLRSKLFYKLGYPGADLIVCQTEYMKNQLIQALPWLENKVKTVVINNPFNIDDKLNRNKESVDVLPSEPFIVAAGRMVPAKGFDILIKAYATIHEQINCKLFILGEGEDYEKLKGLSEDLGLANKVIFTGLVQDVYPFFELAAVTVLSSRIEGFPNVLLQMMSQNQNVVSTLSAGDIDKIPGIYTCPTNDSEALGKSILDCFRTDNSRNRPIFDSFLAKRDYDSFVAEIIGNLND